MSYYRQEVLPWQNFLLPNFFDANGNGQMDFPEELLAMKVFEDALPEDEAASYDELDSDWNGLMIPDWRTNSLRTQG